MIEFIEVVLSGVWAGIKIAATFIGSFVTGLF